MNHETAGHADLAMSDSRDKWLGSAILFLSSGAFLSILRSEDTLTSGSRSGAIGTELLWLVLYILVLYRWLKNYNTISDHRLPWHLIALYLVILASVFWSDAPMLSAVKIAGLIGSLIVSCYLADCFAVETLISMLAHVLLVSTALCFFFSLFVPSVGVSTGDFSGMWQGIYTHKNTLGLNMALAFALFSLMATSCRRSRVLYLAAASAALVLVLLSQSSTSLVLCLITVLSLSLRPLFQRRFWTATAFCVALPLFVLLLNLESVFNWCLEFFDRDPTLTGRTQLWGAILLVSEHSWWGYGYGAFWRGVDGPSLTVWKLSGFDAFYSHNGFLDVWLDVGYVGLLMLLIGLGITFRSAFNRWRSNPVSESLWHILFLLYFFFSNLTEGTFLAINQVSWLLYITIAIKIFRSESAVANVQKAV